MYDIFTQTKVSLKLTIVWYHILQSDSWLLLRKWIDKKEA